MDFVGHRLARQALEATRANTVPLDVLFEDKLTLSLGARRVVLHYHGPNDRRGSISVLFDPAGAAFVVDRIVLGRMPWQKLRGYDRQGMINSTREVLELDFERLVGGHAEIGEQSRVRRYLAYFEDPGAAVIKAPNRNQPLAEMKKSIALPAYSDFAHCEAWLPLNIEGVHERLMEESGMGWRPASPLVARRAAGKKQKVRQ